LLDPNTMTKDGTTSVGSVVPTWDGKKVAYTTQANNSDESVMHVMDVATGKQSERDTIAGLRWTGASWTPKGDGFYYTWSPAPGKVPEADRPGYAEIRFHKLGTDPAKDQIAFPATHDPKTFLGGGISRDGHWLYAYVERSFGSNDVHLRDMRQK